LDVSEEQGGLNLEFKQAISWSYKRTYHFVMSGQVEKSFIICANYRFSDNDWIFLFRGLLYSLVFPVLCQFLNLCGLVESILQNCWWLVSFWRLEIVAVHGNEQVTQTSTRRMGRRLVLYWFYLALGY
jgi:hypothetical protein